MRRNAAWTPDADAMLAELWRAGLPADTIGGRLGRTANAVKIRAGTIGLPGRRIGEIQRDAGQTPGDGHGGRRHGVSWTPERVAEVQALRAEGLSNTAVAQRLGVTKAVIEGVVQRLSLPKRRVVSPPAGNAGGATGGAAKLAKVREQSASAAVVRAAPQGFRFGDYGWRWRDVRPLGRRGLPEFHPATCQFLHGEPRDRNFCGAAVVCGRPYCPVHLALCVAGSGLAEVITGLAAEEAA